VSPSLTSPHSGGPDLSIFYIGRPFIRQQTPPQIGSPPATDSTLSPERYWSDDADLKASEARALKNNTQSSLDDDDEEEESDSSSSELKEEEEEEEEEGGDKEVLSASEQSQNEQPNPASTEIPISSSSSSSDPKPKVVGSRRLNARRRWSASTLTTEEDEGMYIYLTDLSFPLPSLPFPSRCWPRPTLTKPPPNKTEFARTDPFTGEIRPPDPAVTAASASVSCKRGRRSGDSSGDDMEMEMEKEEGRGVKVRRVEY